MISAIVFDFDGVLADSEVLHLRAYQEVLAPLGVELSRADYFARYLGFDDAGVFRTFGGDHGLGARARGRSPTSSPESRRSSRRSRRARTCSSPAPHSASDGSRRQFPLGIASGALRHEIEAVLNTGWPPGLFRLHRRVRRYACGQAGAGSVPAGRGPSRAASRLPASQSRTLGGVSSRARTAGLACVGITQTYSADELLGCRARSIDSLDELSPTLIRSLRSS